MRKDFNKLLCERARKGGKRRSKQRISLKDISVAEQSALPDEVDFMREESFSFLEEESSKRKLKGRENFDRKMLNENLAPLQRFLLSKIGKPWDDVYKEISENLRKDKAINLHVFQHLNNFVEKRTRVTEDGGVEFFVAHRYYFDKFADNGWLNVKMIKKIQTYSAFPVLYVHPKTKALCVAISTETRAKKKRDKKVKSFDWKWHQHPSDCMTIFHLSRERQWSIISLDFLNKREFPQDMRNDAILRTKTHYDAYFEENVSLQHLLNHWGRKVFASSKRLLSKKEIRQFDLWNLKQKADQIPRYHSINALIKAPKLDISKYPERPKQIGYNP